MKGYILFQNKGLLDPLALSLMGASTKRGDDTKIGRFGSGLKYASAWLLRNNIPFRVFSGDDEIIIATRKVSIKDKVFDMITVNGNDTSLTTEMGPDWKDWQAIRELWCNALDEGDASSLINESGDMDVIFGRDEYTRVYVGLTEVLMPVVSNWNQYFTHDRVDAIVEANGFTVYPSTGITVLFRMGIRCMENDKKAAIYQYNHNAIPINEQRVVEDFYMCNRRICDGLAKFANFEIAQAILSIAFTANTFEADLPWDDFDLNPSWVTAAKSFAHIILKEQSGRFEDEMKQDNIAIVNYKMSAALAKVGIHTLGTRKDGYASEWFEAVLTKKNEFRYNKLLENLNELGITIPEEIKVVEFSSDYKVADYDGESNSILLSTKVFDDGALQSLAHVVCMHYKLKSRKVSSNDFELLLTDYLSNLQEQKGYFL